MKTLTTAALTLLVAFLLMGSGALVTHAATPQDQSQSQQQLSLGVQGYILNAGTQQWKVSGGSLLGAQLGQQLVQTGSVQYRLNAKVQGLSATGSFSMSLSGTTASGQSASLTAQGPVVGMIPSICFPNYDVPSSTGTCASGDTSAIPGFFEAAVSMSETIGTTTTSTPEMLLVESPIMSPWGAPIAISSVDGSVNVIATYQTGMVTWLGVQLTGPLSGTLGSQAVTGTFYQTTNAVENLVSGSETELGTISFQGMSISSLNSNGVYMGSSTVPTAGSYDCSALAGLPEGTCTETGLTSTGMFQMFGSVSIQGSYQVWWPAPSITCSGTITATVSQGFNNNNN